MRLASYMREAYAIVTSRTKTSSSVNMEDAGSLISGAPALYEEEDGIHSAERTWIVSEPSCVTQYILP